MFKLYDYDGTEMTYKEFFVDRTKIFFSPVTSLYTKYNKIGKTIIGILGMLGLVMSLVPQMFVFGQILYGFAFIVLIIIPYFKKEKEKNEN